MKWLVAITEGGTYQGLLGGVTPKPRVFIEEAGDSGPDLNALKEPVASGATVYITPLDNCNIYQRERMTRIVRRDS